MGNSFSFEILCRRSLGLIFSDSIVLVASKENAVFIEPAFEFSKCSGDFIERKMGVSRAGGRQDVEPCVAYFFGLRSDRDFGAGAKIEHPAVTRDPNKACGLRAGTQQLATQDFRSRDDFRARQLVNLPARTLDHVGEADASFRQQAFIPGPNLPAKKTGS